MPAMELVSFAKEVIQNVAEQAASYRIGQTALRHIDRALWVVEKCARWAVPPPLDQDERPQPELVRPLPWVFFLALLVTLRVARESISLVNLVLGKPPLRSADVVMYIQSKRRYLRTLKYQGSRMIRARSVPAREPWYSGLRSLFEFTMCFRRSHNYGNNNTTRVSNNDEVLVVKRSKRRDPASPAASTSEATMERLIERMMVDLDAESDDDSSFTLTNATSIRSDCSDDSDSEQDKNENTSTFNSTKLNDTALEPVNIENNVSPIKGDVASSTPEKVSEQKDAKSTEDADRSKETKTSPKKQSAEESHLQRPPKSKSVSPKQESLKFIQSERCAPQKSQQSPKNTRIDSESDVALVRINAPDHTM